MPVISMFHGLLISMYFMDSKRHHTPHVHVRYQEHEAVYDVTTGDVLEGELPKPKARLVQAWIELRREDLLADWQLATQGLPLFQVEPLR
ncbi:MAG: DUF4160 domain-containing protein [Deltaproteobacteria bacterium]|nr:DUF4160 domain-containing protein [Deltaproteobacteria bacterium]